MRRVPSALRTSGKRSSSGSVAIPQETTRMTKKADRFGFAPARALPPSNVRRITGSKPSTRRSQRVSDAAAPGPSVKAISPFSAMWFRADFPLTVQKSGQVWVRTPSTERCGKAQEITGTRGSMSGGLDSLITDSLITASRARSRLVGEETIDRIQVGAGTGFDHVGAGAFAGDESVVGKVHFHRDLAERVFAFRHGA